MKAFNNIIYLALCIVLTGCGLAQSVSEGTANVAKAIFIWDVRTVHLDFTARAELNIDDNHQSSPVMIRIYQLKEPKNFESATYSSLVQNDQETLAASLLATKEIVLKPKTSISIDMPFDKEADYVGIIALFKDPDIKANNWRILLKRGDLNINSPRSIIANKFSITLVAEE